MAEWNLYLVHAFPNFSAVCWSCQILVQVWVSANETHEKVEERSKQESDPGCMRDISKQQVFIVKGPGGGESLQVCDCSL